jgi:exopolysaccharide production protein ExoZ
MQITPLSTQGLALADPHPRGKSTIFGVQALRFLAAVLVVILHALNQEITFKVHPLPSQQWMQGGVDIFFVISGFIMVYIVKPDTRPGTFWLQRFTRIAPLYWIATAVAYVGGIVAPAWFFGPHSAWFALTSALFIPPDNFQWALPLLSVGWTLNFEFAFYSILAACLVFRRPPFAAATVAIVVVVASGIMLKPYLYFMGYYADHALMLEFLFGMGAAVLVRDHGLRPWHGLVIAAIGLTLLALLWDFQLGWPRGIRTGLPAFLVVFGILVSEPLWQRHEALRQFARLGDASYSIYLTHFFFIVALSRLWKTNPGAAALGPIGYLAIAIPLGIAMGILVHLLVERPLLAVVRTRLKRRQARRSQPDAAPA